ncbi:glycosyltransferase family 4 protein [Opitutales bacterium]|nr:glycosyltransferase family 4 protein [Opitutales bacterium]MDB2681504.1 glycosyltransferase family 4 protein [Opitutales bacterium]
MKVKLIFRKPRPSYFSIEGLFNNILSHFDADVAAEKWECPHLSSGLVARVKNMWSVKKEDAQVYHITGDVHYLAMALPASRSILTIHDAAVLGRLAGLRRYIYKLFWFDWPLRRVACVTVISEATREYLKAHTNVSDFKLRVIPDCISDAFEFSPEPLVEIRPRLLQIGTKKNKNIERIAQALSGLNCELRIVGKLSPEQEAVLQREGVNYTTCYNLTEAELIKEYTACHALIFASTIEGFGMPILEAQATGRAVITSNCSSMPEVGGDGACYVDPLLESSIREGIDRVLQNKDYRQELIARGQENVKKYSPTAIAALYAKAYEDVANAN